MTSPMDQTRHHSGQAFKRRVLRLRALMYTGGAVVLTAAGVTTSYVGWAILDAYLLIALWSLAAASTEPVRQISLPETVIDVLAPSLTGILVGHDPYSLHLLVGAQIAGALLISPPRIARRVALTPSAAFWPGSLSTGGTGRSFSRQPGTGSPNLELSRSAQDSVWQLPLPPPPDRGRFAGDSSTQPRPSTTMLRRSGVSCRW